jgi:hypothetical protein
MDSNIGRDVLENARGPLHITQSAESLARNTWNCTNYPSPNTKTSFHFAMSGVCFSVVYWKKHAGWMTHLHHPLALKRVFGPFTSKSQAFAQCETLLNGDLDDPRHLGLFPVETLRTAYPNGVLLSSERDQFLATSVHKLKQHGALVDIFLADVDGQPVVRCSVACFEDEQLLKMLDTINNAWPHNEQLFWPTTAFAPAHRPAVARELHQV